MLSVACFLGSHDYWLVQVDFLSHPTVDGVLLSTRAIMMGAHQSRQATGRRSASTARLFQIISPCSLLDVDRVLSSPGDVDVSLSVCNNPWITLLVIASKLSLFNCMTVTPLVTPEPDGRFSSAM